MVRTYVRKTQKGAGFTYTREDLEKALDDVRNGNKTTRGAAIHYNIPRSTLKHYVRGTRGIGNISVEKRGGGGVKSYLLSADEQEIANCIRVMEKNG
jgi:helix-turn-helix, Psq domain